MKYKIQVYSILEYGERKDANGNPHQEDCIFPLPEDLSDTDRTFILCDGMGGHDAGEVASSTVCQAMGQYIITDGHDPEGEFTDEDLYGAIDAAFRALDAKDNGAAKKMGTTMTFLKLHNDGATIAYMGDSRVYHIRPGEDGEDSTILYTTEDHSLVNDLIKIGELKKEDAWKSKQKNIITRAMQPNMERRPKADIYHTPDIRPGDFFYMCSDGMLEQEDMANGKRIREIFSDAIPNVDDKVRTLIEETRNNRDNHTALIIRIDNVEEQGSPASDGETITALEYEMATAEEADSQEAFRPKKRSSILKNVWRCVAVAIPVAACVIGIRYIHFGAEDNTDQADSRQELEEVKAEDREERAVELEQPEEEPGAEAQEAAIDDGTNIVETPPTIAPDSIAQSPADTNFDAAAVIQILNREPVVNSDIQAIRDSLNNK